MEHVKKVEEKKKRMAQTNISPSTDKKAFHIRCADIFDDDNNAARDVAAVVVDRLKET